MPIDSPSVRVVNVQPDQNDETMNGAENIIRTFMIEQERIAHSTSRGRRNSVVDQIFRGHGQQLQEEEPNSDVGRQLAEYAVQLDAFYRRETDQYIDSLERHPENRLANLQRIIRGVFQHGITAGHVISLFQFGYWYVHYIINKGIENGEEICRQIMKSIIDYIRDYVVTWIRSIGGWNGFLEEVKVFVMGQAAFWTRNRVQLGLAVITVFTAINVGALLLRYRS